MTLIEIKDNSIKISGHANYAPKGQDIVCAALSAIIQSSVTWFDKKDIEVKQDKKTPSFELTLIKNIKSNEDKINLLKKQLEFIQKHYKKYIKIIRR